LLNWKRQSAAWSARVSLATGGHATVVIVGPRHSEKGAALLLPQPGDQPKTVLFPAALEYLDAATIIGVLAAQEREHGSVLPRLPVSAR